MDEKYGLIFWLIVLVFSALKNLEKIKMKWAKTGNLWKIVILTVIALSAFYNFEKLYNKYFKIDFIVYEPRVSKSYINFVSEKDRCDDQILIFTKNDLWNPSANVKKCSDGKKVHWTSTAFSYGDLSSEPIWIIKYEK